MSKTEVNQDSIRFLKEQNLNANIFCAWETGLPWLINASITAVTAKTQFKHTLNLSQYFGVFIWYLLFLTLIALLQMEWLRSVGLGCSTQYGRLHESVTPFAGPGGH